MSGEVDQGTRMGRVVVVVVVVVVVAGWDVNPCMAVGMGAPTAVMVA